MCASYGAASLASSAIGGIGDAASSIFAASSEKLGLKLASRIADLNASSEDDNARESLRRGNEDESRLRLETGFLKGRQIAAMGANGVRLDDGSPLNRLVSTDYMAEVDAATIRQNAAREAAGYRTRATSYRNEALMRRTAARGVSPFVSGLTSLVGSAQKVASDWYDFRQKGVEVSVGRKRRPPSRSERPRWGEPGHEDYGMFGTGPYGFPAR